MVPKPLLFGIGGALTLAIYLGDQYLIGQHTERTGNLVGILQHELIIAHKETKLLLTTDTELVAKVSPPLVTRRKVDLARAEVALELFVDLDNIQRIYS